MRRDIDWMNLGSGVTKMLDHYKLKWIKLLQLLVYAMIIKIG